MKNYFGILICVFIALPAHLIGTAYPVIGGPVIAILVGMILSSSVSKKQSLSSGIRFTSKKILQLAVILLGFGMNINQIFQSGKESLPVILSTIAIALLTAAMVSKMLRIEKDIAILVGVGSAICGGSAIAATAPVIDASDKDIAQAISVIFFFNVIAAVIFPILGEYLQLSNEGFGLFAGTAINDTSSVTAAASSWDQKHGSSALQIATIVKLTRTLAIIPITIGLSILRGKETNHQNRLVLHKLVPPFLLLFLLASVITTLFPIPADWISLLKVSSKFLITMAMAAIGLNTDILKLVKTGGKSILLGFICWVVIATTSILVQNLIGLM